MLKKVPEQYENEYFKNQISFIKARIRLLCTLTIALAFADVALSIFLSSVTKMGYFNWREIPVLCTLVLLGLLILYITERVKTLRAAKICAYLFIMMFLFLTIKSFSLYPEYIKLTLVMYLFTFFLAAFTIPWTPLEILPVSFMHVVVLTLLFMFAREFMSAEYKAELDAKMYVSGVITFFFSTVFCMVIRKNETNRDIENFVLLKEVEKKNTQMRKELELANKVHARLIPRSTNNRLADIAVTYLPAYYIGGDYAKFQIIDDNKLMFIICDVTGHGVSAALLVNTIHSEIESLMRESYGPGELLKRLNNFISRDFEKTNMFLTAFCGMLDYSSMKFSYSNYGHLPQYLFRVTEAAIEPLKAQTSLVGIDVQEIKLYQSDLGFSKGDQILLFTDGITEARNSKGEEYGPKKLEGFIKKHHNLQVDIFNKRLMEELNSFSGSKFIDDIFVLNIQSK
ncbi:MAG: PP2C family protein-serine/threonine phosphatase [Candidatus Omnitrophota bacterium]